ncbi:MAG: membrane integrity-associated transporter subunit PqiC [Betaproteobacteria bacterium]
MPGQRQAAWVVLVPAALAATGCVTLKRTPEARFFVLRPLVEPKAAAGDGAAGGEALGLLPVRVPDHLERPQLVLWAGPNELRVDEFLRWAEPLDAGVARTLAGDLSALLPRMRVVPAPWAAAAAPRLRLSTELRVFGAQADGRVALEGEWALLSGREERVLARRAFALSRGPLAGGSEPGAAVEAMSALLADLSREIAGAVLSLPPPAAAP